MKEKFLFVLLLLLSSFCFLGETSIINAQVQYTTISICKICNDAQERGSGKCVGCNKYESLTKIKAKICFDCYFKRGGLLERGCWFCKANTVGGGDARLCSECAKKDECIVCGIHLGSGDAYSEADNRRVVERYTVQIKVPGQKEKFQEYLNSASNAMANEEFEQAITYFKKCEEIIPNSMACNIGVALRELKKNDDALSHFDIAIKEDPNWGDPYGEKAITLAYLGRWNDAGPLLKKSIDLKYDSPTVFWMYGKYLEEILKKPSEAIPFYEKVIAKNPAKSYKLYNNIGDIYFNEEKYDDAERAYKKVLEHDKNDFNALAFSGEINFKKQNFEDALKYYLLSHKIKPDNLELNFHMGICYGYLNQLEKAENYFKHALSIDPNLTDVSLELARLYKSYGVFAKAIPIYKKLISDDAVTHPAYLDLALCQYMNKQYKDAIESCKKFIEKDTGNYPDPYKWMAVAAARLNEKQEAEKYCNKAIELNVENQCEIFYFVAAAYSLMNDSEKALLYLEKAIKRGMPKESSENDSEFDNIRNSQGYKNLIDKL
jgi:tetratricopeptide (TPR) repeat protein